MKKIFLSILSLGLMFSLNSCRDESLNPLPGWDPAVHGFGVFDGVSEVNKRNIVDYAKNFTATNQQSSNVPFKIRWVSLDNKLTVNKIELYVEMIEYYNDPDGNPKAAGLGQKLAKTIATPAGNRQWNSFTISASEVFNLFKDATVKYDKVKSVPVFNNPDNPRPTGRWFNGATDDFVLSWWLYTADGKVFRTFNQDSICGDPTPVSEANANCQLIWSVN
jgi:hypothetical protein